MNVRTFRLLGYAMRIDPAIWPTLSALLDLDRPEAAWLDRLDPAYADILPTLRDVLSA